MKKFITTLLSLALVIGMCPAMIANAETIVTLQGTGIETDPYQISSAAELKAARDLINANANGEADAYFKVTADITLPDDELWTPIAPYSTVPFTGTFDGAEHVISNINIELNDTNYSSYTSRPNLGFFGTVGDTGSNGGTVTNLGLSDVSVVNNLEYIQSSSTCSWNGRPNSLGGFAGDVNRNSVFTGCFVKDATIENNGSGNYMSIGGFFGTTRGGQKPEFINCYVYDATISAGVGTTNYRDTIGGFAGSPGNANTTFTNCYVAQTFTTQASSEKTAFYAFSRKGTGPYTSATACYAEADDIATITDAVTTDGTGTHKDTFDYSKDTSLGTVGMTKEGLVEAMTAVGYSTDATVNDGYPCLAWEKANTKWNGEAATAFAGGDGTEENPYKITTAAQLKLAADRVNKASGSYESFYFSLQNDIDYENNYWTPIGYSNADGDRAFRGAFYGNGHVIKNLEIDHTEAYRYCGFFGLIGNAEISNLGIENFQLVHNNSTSGKQFRNIAGFAAEIRNNTTITNCYLKDSAIKQTSQWSSCETILSGFIGNADLRDSTMEVKNCYVQNIELQGGVQIPVSAFFNGVLNSTNEAATNVKFTNCYVANITNANTQATLYAFGFMGGAYNNQLAFDANKIILTNCYSEATTTEGSYAAGDDANKWQLVDDTYFGTEKQSEAQIASALETLEGWQDGENINAGLPALAWEPAPVIYPYVVKAVSATKGTVTLAVNKDVTTGDKVYIATYDSTGRLVSVDIKDAAANITDVNVTTDGASKVKVLIWNGLTPVINSVVKDLY